MLLQIEHSLHFSYSDYIRESHMDIRVELEPNPARCFSISP